MQRQPHSAPMSEPGIEESAAEKTLGEANSKSARPGFLLIIERGQSRFPERPIGDQRFLIGAGSNCQLQLGGDIPLLHSIIVPEGDHLWIDAVVSQPELIVNGQQVREGELRNGDVIEIGEFVFSVGLQRHIAAVAAPATELSIESATAPELLDRLLEEMEGLNRFEASRRRGAATLLEAARRVSEEADAARKDPAERILALLENLRARARALDEREATLNDQSHSLAQAQLELQGHLTALQLSMNEPAPLRKSA